MKYLEDLSLLSVEGLSQEVVLAFFLGALIAGLLVVILKNKSLLKLSLQLREEETRAEIEREKIRTQQEFLTAAQQTLRDSFRALSAEALEKNSSELMERSKLQLEKFQETAKGDLQLRQHSIFELVKPMKEQLEKVDLKLNEVERSRIGDQTKIQEQIASLINSESQLRIETSKLVTALRKPNVRGRWGEIQLRRVVEIAGMLAYCDFYEQQSFDGENEKVRPDMCVRLPSEREIVVDSKVPLQSFLDALDISDPDLREQRLKEHAGLVRAHVNKLSNKSYWERVSRAPEFVVLFLPSESFFSAALEQDPGLIEYAVSKNVIPATPTTLISLLQAVAIGWREEQIAKNAREIQEMGKDFYDKATKLASHFSVLGNNLEKTVKSYNEAAGSYESRFLVSARRFKELGVQAASPIPELERIEITPRALNQAAIQGPEEAEQIKKDSLPI